jgi:hypothetical protein
MRSYNYVIIPIHDFDHVIYNIRAIDFDQQCYEGKLNVYRPQFFKENYEMVKLVQEKLQKSSVNQYKIEERSMVAKRFSSYEIRIKKLINCMKKDSISNEKNITLLKEQTYNLTSDINFKRSENMGELLNHTLDYVKRNYEKPLRKI